MQNDPKINLETVEIVAAKLRELNDEIIYVGGATVSLYATDPAAEEQRPTKDIDISIQISTYAEMTEFQERLERKGIFPANDTDILYRFKLGSILIDFIPFEPTGLGPTNSWFKPGFAKAKPIKIGEQNINILPVELFLASKWEAFNSRGGDPRTSKDFEDIIYVLDNHIDLERAIEQSDDPEKAFLKGMAKAILNHENFPEIIECHLSPEEAQERGLRIKDILKRIAERE